MGELCLFNHNNTFLIRSFMNSKLELLGLNSKYLDILRSANFQYIHEVIALNASQLSKELHVPLQEAFEIIQILKNLNGKTNSKKLVQRQETIETISFVTGCKNFDNLLGGNGIVSGSLIEICGSFGVGKTTFLMQCASTATLPKECGGLDSKVLYIDTEGSFSKYKLEKIAQNVHKQFKIAYPQVNLLNSDEILKKIDYYRATDLFEFLSCISLLEVTASLEQYKLIIIDSITEHFRHTIEGTERSNILYNIADRLKILSRNQPCCVILSNQMRTNIEVGKRNELVPALGDKWSHAISCRIVMSKTLSGYSAQLYKSVRAEQQKLGYCIDSNTSLISDAELKTFNFQLPNSNNSEGEDEIQEN